MQRVSILKAAALVAVVLPGALVLIDILGRTLGPRPMDEIIHRTGNDAVWILMVALAVTPLSRIARWPQLMLVRRIVGVAVFCYAFVHFGAYVVDQAFDLAKVAREIVLRVYLTIGFVALVGLGALAATSTDAMTRRLGGRRWRRLHALVYPIGLLGVIHFFLQTKLDNTEPAVCAGVFLWLMAYRAIVGRRLPPAWIVLGLGVGAGAATMAGEALGLSLAFGAPFLDILSVNFSFDTGVRPGWVVLGAGLAVAALAAWRSARRIAARRPAAETA
ncbi:MAG: sulfite oxidase heme-binding subunit YedZ [Rhodospirillales bacterium]